MHNILKQWSSCLLSDPAGLLRSEKFQLCRCKRLVAASMCACLRTPLQLCSSWILSGEWPRNKQSNPIKLLKLNCTMVMEYLIELLIFRGFRQQPISSKYKVHTLKLTPEEDRAFIWGKWYIIITSRWKNHKLYRVHLIRKWKWLIGLDKTNLALSTLQCG